MENFQNVSIYSKTTKKGAKNARSLKIAIFAQYYLFEFISRRLTS